MNLSQLNNVANLVDPDFMWACELLVVKEGDEYRMPQNGVWVKIHKDIVMRDMDTRRRRTLVVDPSGRVLDTNMILCEECGVPVLDGDYCKECKTPVE